MPKIQTDIYIIVNGTTRKSESEREIRLFYYYPSIHFLTQIHMFNANEKRNIFGLDSLQPILFYFLLYVQ